MKLHKKKVQNTLKVAKNEDWLVDYAIYMSMKMDNMNKKWQDWPKDEKNRQPVVLSKYRKTSENR